MLRYNVVGIQMLRKSLRDHIFKKSIKANALNETTKAQMFEHLKKFNIPYDKIQTMESVDLKLPPLKGNSIEEHFRNIASEQTNPYINLANKMVGTALPVKPKQWKLAEGWTKYDVSRNETLSVEFPDEDVLVIDVESFVPSGGHPLMVTAVSPTGWYSWCSKHLVSDSDLSEAPGLSDLVRVSDRARPERKSLLVGHNVGFDRSFFREQYLVESSKTNFLDTMSMHIAVCGFTSYQRTMHTSLQKSKGHSPLAMQRWMTSGSLNNLSDVYRFHCKRGPLDKQLRDVFVEGTLGEIKENFQELMSYCANDVSATYEVFKALWPKFRQRFPHPVTLGGMFEMGKAYLPVNRNWFDYLDRAQTRFDEMEGRGQALLTSLAEEAKLKGENDGYKQDMWLWDLDWTKKMKRLKKVEAPSTNKSSKVKAKRMTDYAPKWYAELCEVDDNNNMRPVKISLQRRLAVKLLQMVWKGFPLHYSRTHGWGYLVPFSSEVPHGGHVVGPESDVPFPLQQLVEYCKVAQPEVLRAIQENNNNNVEMIGIEKELLNDIDTFWDFYDTDLKEIQPIPRQGQGVSSSIDLPILNVVPGCYFYKLPHKDGDGKNVGNPLSKGFHDDIDHGVLGSLLGKSVDDILKQGSVSSYWKNNVKRIRSQFVIRLDNKEFPEDVTRDPNFDPDGFYGAIVPRIVTAGTVTRRAVEPTWLTASNAYSNRIGSELKSMVQCPPGYSFVGADVDSQELWIAALLGDSHFAGEHGCTAFGWMTLQGTKAEGTDMHSRVAEMLGISRDHAKIFNYGRIYGAGLKFAEQMLLKFNPLLTKEEAKARATNMFHSTKGKRIRGKFIDEGTYQEPEWLGGSESFMFNKLERIASSRSPKTPVLGASMSRTIEPAVVGKDFMTSRVNWVVQSSAVDYLHLMLVCMRWLLEEYRIGGRFCISIHDEVRYLVPDADRHRAALALQITNLFVRSAFAQGLGFDDLPQSVAFFSSVEIDRCLRKDALNDCITPSNERGMLEEYGIPKGESLTIDDILKKTNGSLEANSRSSIPGEAVQPCGDQRQEETAAL